MKRVTKGQLFYAEKSVNSLLSNIKLCVKRRYDYYAVDIYKKDGNCIDTLIANLTAREILELLYAIYRILLYEKNI